MSTKQITANHYEKQRLREAIRSQVEEFLSRGGTIEVFDGSQWQQNRDRRASAWHDQASISLAAD